MDGHRHRTCSAIHINQVQTLILTAQACRMQALVRVYANDAVIIKRVLDAGADGVIVPMINSKADALAMVDNMYYPPRGKRGAGLSRAQKYGIGFEAYQKHLEQHIVLVAQIENIKDILSVEAIDATIIGPYDRSASMGKPGQYHLPEVQKTIQAYDEGCLAMDKPRGAHVISSDASELRKKKSKKDILFWRFRWISFFGG